MVTFFYRCLLVATLAVTGVSCRAPHRQNKLTSMGLLESVIGRGEVHQAMDIVNTLTRSKNLKQILCGWETEDFSDKELYYFLTQSEGLPLKTIAQTSKENNSIFISSSWRSVCDDIFDLSETDSVLRTHALVFVLLHELGHLLGNSDYSSLSSSTIRIDSLVLKNETSMREELLADFFAAEIVKTSQTQVGRELAQNIEELYSRVDYHYARKYGIHGGGLRMMLAEPAKRFSDLSYSHPNLNLRMHLLSYLIHPSPEKLSRLEWVQEQRRLFFNINNFTHDIMDGLTSLKILPEDSNFTEENNK